MDDQRQPSLTPRSGGGVFRELSLRVRLIARLIGDRRVNPLIKLLPIVALLYLIIPDLAPGPLDDAAVIWLGASLFVELCPAAVVQEHMDALNPVVEGEWRVVDETAGQIEGKQAD
jgi:hypothetical protein